MSFMLQFSKIRELLLSITIQELSCCMESALFFASLGFLQSLLQKKNFISEYLKETAIKKLFFVFKPHAFGQ